jgi:hypothetical protein
MIDEILTCGFPTKWSKWTAVLTLFVTSLAYNAPSLLPQTWLPNSQEQIFLIRLLLSETILLLGSFAVIILVVIAHNAKDVTVNVEISELNDDKKH